jgi:hypothetical protein
MRDNSPGVYFGSPNTSTGVLYEAESKPRETPNGKEKLNGYFTQRVPSRIQVKQDPVSLNALLKNYASTQISTLQNTKDVAVDKSEKKLRIEIKSRDLANQGYQSQQVSEKLDRKFKLSDKSKPKGEEVKTPKTLKTLDVAPHQRSKIQLFRAKSDNDNDKLSRSPRVATPDKKI